MNPEGTPKSSTGDIHELRYRISQLEHLVATTSLSSSSALENSSLPSNSSALRTPHGLIQRVNELEGLLAASEGENRFLAQRLEQLTADKNRGEVALLEKLFHKDTELKDANEDLRLTNVRLQKAQTKLENVKDYINGLPCQDELDEAKNIINKLEDDNHLLDAQIGRMKDQVANLQKDLLEKERTLSDAQVRLEELRPLEEAQTSVLKERDLNTLNLKDENGVLELLTLQKAQILRSAKLITTLRDRISKLDAEKGEALIKISNLEADIESLQEQFLTGQLQMDRITQKAQITETEKTKLAEEHGNLLRELESRNAYVQRRDEQLTDLLKLMTEIDLCVNEVGKLVELGQSIATGQEPPVDTLLGLSDDLELHVQSLDSGVFSNDSGTRLGLCDDVDKVKMDPSDPEWILGRMKEVRQLRKSLCNLRDISNDLYTDMLSGNVEGCKVQ